MVDPRPREDDFKKDRYDCTMLVKIEIYFLQITIYLHKIKEYAILKIYFTSMKKITKKSLWKAFKWLVLLSACTHLILLFISFLQTQDVTLINYFNIIDLDLFIPNIENGIVSQIFSLWIILLLYIFLFMHYRKIKA